MKSRAATLYSRTYVSWNARCSFCYNTLLAETHSVPLLRHIWQNQIAEIHERNPELQCSLYEHTVAEDPVLFCYVTYDSWHARIEYRAAMLSSRTYDSWNSRCSFVTAYDSENARLFFFVVGPLAGLSGPPVGLSGAPGIAWAPWWNARTKSSAAMISTRRTIPSFGTISKFDNCDYIGNWWSLSLKQGHRVQSNYLTIRFTINWLVLILLVAPGTTLAFLGYNSQEVIVVLPNAGHSILWRA